MGNTTVSGALLNRYFIPTAKEHMCKKCGESLVTGKMPTDAVALWIRLPIDKQGQQCTYCNSVATGKVHIF